MKWIVLAIVILLLALGFFFWAAATVASRADDANPHLRDEGDDEKKAGR